MDFNDLNVRLKRLYVTLGEQYDADISSNIVDTRISLGDGRFEHQTTFGTNDPEVNQNKVMSAIHALGSLKDIIQQRLRSTGQDPQLYEEQINKNLALGLITDLDNKEKHGDPLTRPSRSGVDPRLANIQQGIHGKGITRLAFTTNFSTGKTTLNQAEGDVKIGISADVVGSSGDVVMSLSDMLEGSLRLVESFVETHKLRDVE